MCYRHFTAANTFLIMKNLFVYGQIYITLKGRVHVAMETRKLKANEYLILKKKNLTVKDIKRANIRSLVAVKHMSHLKKTSLK